jgi:hypothetical protein
MTKIPGNAGKLDHHADMMVLCGAHHLMERIQGFTRSHWMLLLGKFLRRIAPAATKVIDLTQKH